MASSGYFNTGSYEGRYLQFSWTESSQSVANNTTTIKWTLKGLGGGSTWYNAGNFKVVIAGETVYSSATRIRLSNGTQVASGTYTFKHGADGTKTFAASAEAGIYSVAVNCKGSGNFTLDTIARASQPSCVTWPNHTQDVGSFGDTISIHMNRNSSAFTHTVRYAFGSMSGTCVDADTGKAATGVTTGIRWKIPETFMTLLPTTTSGSGTIYVDTYNGSTLIGTKYCGFTATVPASVKPTCSIQVLDATNTQDIYGNLVRGLSKLYVKTTGAPSYGSPIRAYSVTANDVRYAAAEITTGVLTKAGTTTITANVTDGRGRTSTTASASFAVLDYAPPNISKLTAVRCNQDGTANKRGGYIKVVFSASVTALNSKNTALYKVKYKKTTDTAYTTVTISALTNQYAVTNHAYIFAASVSSSYDITVEATDRHNSAHPTSKSTKAPTGASVFSWRGFKTSSGMQDGAGIGKVPEKANTLQVGWDAEFDNAVVTKGNQYCFSSIGAATTDGFILMARITITAENSDSPITFEFSRRTEIAPMTVHICFKSTANMVPGLKSITYEGANYDAYLTNSSASVWDLYVRKVNQSDTVTLNRWYTSERQMKRMTVEFVGSIASQVPTGLVGYYKATPLVAKHIVDAFYSVGSVMIRYDHADPNTMYPGTTWVRITNRFLWGCDADGDVGVVGGEKTVTLTTAQMPSHTHGAVYSADASGTKNLPWLSTGVLGTGDKLAYSTVATGGSAAHNNMPPYIQVSIWRRTA